MEDQPSETVSTCTDVINFKTAKEINNDLVDILRALQEIKMRTEVGKEIKKRYIEAVMYELEKLEESKIVL
jgi:hypothetical protein